MRFILSILSIFMCSCSLNSCLTNRYTVYISPSLGDRTDAAIKALEEWEHMSDNVLHFDIIIGDVGFDRDSSDYRDTIVIRTKSYDEIGAMEPASWCPNKCYGVTKSKYFYNHAVSYVAYDSPTDEIWRSVMTHEIGHALGLGHDTDESDLMYPSVTWRTAPRRHVRCRDVDEVLALRSEFSNGCREGDF